MFEAWMFFGPGQVDRFGATRNQADQTLALIEDKGNVTIRKYLEDAPSADEIRAALEGRLVSYKIPAEVTFIDAIPKTASGKILRRQLRDAYA